MYTTEFAAIYYSNTRKLMEWKQGGLWYKHMDRYMRVGGITGRFWGHMVKPARQHPQQ